MELNQVVAMRIIGEIPHTQCKITIFHWNGKYLIKLERGWIEQTYKVPELEISGQEDIQKIVQSNFLTKALEQFEAMEANLFEAIENLDSSPL
ncbi:hypothetical protein [Tunicatimonas pelagia]|uniref:hypothetical protein n=1 Tax=Tunicatimonas pelagia TaxID=931531 RepID=UPI0026656298|nr:hypothetical protein [Tunicatimonas pelagia]WKN45859.1 hypothetical protein P0M28_12905 [Tunicatimonas pelagia]